MSKTTNDKIEEIWLMRPDDFPEEYKATKQLIKETLQECIGEEYVFERPKDDYLPNAYIHLKAKNELRQEALTKLEELLND